MRAWQCHMSARSNSLARICVWAGMHQRRIGCRVPEAFQWVHDVAPGAGSIAGTQITGSLVRAIAELGLCTLITDCTLQCGDLTHLTWSHMHMYQAMHALQTRAVAHNIHKEAFDDTTSMISGRQINNCDSMQQLKQFNNCDFMQQLKQNSHYTQPQIVGVNNHKNSSDISNKDDSHKVQ